MHDLVQVGADVVESDIGGRIALFRPETGETLLLSATASDIWRLCDGERTVEAIVRLLAGAYRSDEASIGQDVLSTVTDLGRRGFLSVLPP